jgi:hypothetical protein
LNHPDDIAQHTGWNPELIVSSTPYALDPTDGTCHGRLIVVTSAATITLPSDSSITTNKCHTVRVMLAHSSGTSTIVAGTNTHLYDNLGISMSSEDYGAYIELLYSETLKRWIFAASLKTWVVST